MNDNPFSKLTTFLQSLEQRQISYTVAHYRDEAIMVTAALPGERWEIEFLSDGSVEIEKFASSGEIYGEEVLNELLTQDSDSLQESAPVASKR